MAKEYDFKIVNLDDRDSFEAEVKRLLADGYELHGGLLVLPGRENAVQYIQAVVKNVSQRPSTGFAIGR